MMMDDNEDDTKNDHAENERFLSLKGMLEVHYMNKI
jgi:hypothetical protein